MVQVGHLERFNPAVQAAIPIITQPMFFEVHRLSIFTARSLDVDVVLDLMIHDIDVVLSFVKSPVTEIRAVGLPVVTSKVDIANVRMEFESGCVANFTASRISTEKVRKLRFFSPGNMCHWIMAGRMFCNCASARKRSFRSTSCWALWANRLTCRSPQSRCSNLRSKRKSRCVPSSRRFLMPCADVARRWFRWMTDARRSPWRWKFYPPLSNIAVVPDWFPRANPALSNST